MKVKLTFLGSGSAFTVNANNYQSNLLLEAGGKKLLIDCGTDARHSLNEQGYSHRDVDAVYISHLHSDHIGGMEWLGLVSKFDPQCAKPTLIANDRIMNDLWDQSLYGGMSTLQCKDATLEDYFDLLPVDENGQFVWQNIKFQLVQTVHVISGYRIMPCYGLMFEANNTTIFFTSDTQFAPTQLHDYYHKADLIFHDCETTPFKSGVHAHYSDLNQGVSDDIKSRMWLYHYNPGELPDSKKDGFLGFIVKGQSFEF